MSPLTPKEETPFIPKKEPPVSPKEEIPAKPKEETSVPTEKKAPVSPKEETPAKSEGEALVSAEEKAPSKPKEETPVTSRKEAPIASEKKDAVIPEEEAPVKPEKKAPVPPTETLESPKKELSTGETFARRYQVVEELGKGGMGRVYKVLDNEINEKIALKLLKPEVAGDEKRVQRFRNELRNARKISHKNVCRMYHFSKAEGSFYITMEYVEGEELKSFMKKIGKMPKEKALAIAKQVVAGLAEAHKLGVIHCDLKPMNIMIDKEGNARIMDFGISRSLKGKGVTETGIIIGTPEYMSPEQVEGEEADPRSDIYAMGIILFEMLTGTVPFSGASVLSVIMKQKVEEPPNPRKINPEISEDLSRVILRCLEKNKEKRYQNAEALLSDLRGIEQGTAITAAAPDPQVPTFLAEAEEAAERERPLFVAREHEVEKLSKFLETALTGQGQIAFVTGEAGSGKTTLIDAFAWQSQDKHPDLVVATGNCNAHTGIGDPYLPFRQVMSLLTSEIEARWEAGEISREHANRLWNLLPISLKALVESGPDLIDTFVSGRTLAAHAVAFASEREDWLDGLKKLLEQKMTASAVSSLKQSDLFDQYTKVLQEVARQQPLLLVLDDLQWADLGSVNLLFHLGRQIHGSRILVLGAYRPSEVALGRAGERHPLEPVVNELKRDFGDFDVEPGLAGGREFVYAFIDTEPNQLDSVFRDKLYQQTKGNPLFTVELLRTMQEQGSLVKDNEGRWTKGPELNWEIMPARVDAVISERISRLPDKLQKVLGMASVEGEDFTAEVVARVQEIDDLGMVQLLSEELDKRHRLVSAKGIRQIETQRMSLYRFTHILFQRYLYNNFDKVEKTHLHEKMGTVLEALYGEKAEEISVQLARHFREAGIAAEAVKYLLLAGNKAMQLSANAEAVAHFSEGLELLKTLPASPERAQQELELQVALGAPLQALKGYGAPEVGQTYDRARELCQQIGETPQLFPVLFLLCSFYWVRAEHHSARKLSEQLFNLAQMIQEPVKTAIAQWAQGLCLVYLGEFVPAKAHLEQVIALYDSKKHRSLAFHYAQDPGVSCLMWDSWVLWFLGYPDQALKLSQQAIALAKELDHTFTLAFVLGIASWFHYFRREFEASKELSEACIKISTEKGFELLKAAAPSLRGYTQIAQGQVEDGIAQVKQGLAAWKAMGAEFHRTHCLAWLAEAYVKSGQTKEGLATVAEALDTLEKTGERYYEPELHRIKGELLLQQGIEDIEVKVCFRQAIDIAREQSAKSLELRATISMARLLKKMGNPGEARHLLAEIFGWFTEGLETPDLKEAKALLEGLP